MYQRVQVKKTDCHERGARPSCLSPHGAGPQEKEPQTDGRGWEREMAPGLDHLGSRLLSLTTCYTRKVFQVWWMETTLGKLTMLGFVSL